MNDCDSWEGRKKKEKPRKDRKVWDVREWGRMSLRGEVCGFRGCQVPPERFCSCDLTYCVRHFPEHVARYKDHEAEVGMWGDE